MGRQNRNGLQPGDGCIVLVIGAFIGLTFGIVASLGRLVLLMLQRDTEAYRPKAYDVPIDRLKKSPSDLVMVAQVITRLVLTVTAIVGILHTDRWRLTGDIYVFLIALTIASSVLLRFVFPEVFRLSVATVILLPVGIILRNHSVNFAMYEMGSVVIALSAVVTCMCLLKVTVVPENEAEAREVLLLASVGVALLGIGMQTVVANDRLFINIISLPAVACLGTVILSSEAKTERIVLSLAFVMMLYGFVQWIMREFIPIDSLLFLLASFIIVCFEALQATSKGEKRLVFPTSYLNDPSLTSEARSTFVIYPKQKKYEPSEAVGLVNSLLEITSTIEFSLEIHATNGSTWTVSAPRDIVGVSDLAKAIPSQSKGAVAELRQVPAISNEVSFYRQILLFGLKSDYAVPLQFADQLTFPDPLAFLSNRGTTLEIESDDSVKFQVVVTAATTEAHSVAYRRLNEGKILPRIALGFDPNRPLKGFDEKLLRQKLDVPRDTLYHCFVALMLESKNKDRLTGLAQAASDVEKFHSPGHNRLVRLFQTSPIFIDSAAHAFQPEIPRLLEAWKREKSSAWRDVLCVLSPSEIAALWHVPSEEYQSEGIQWSHARIPEELFAAKNGVPLGKLATSGHKGKKVYLEPTDRAAHHYIVGKTQTGKSTLMAQLIIEDIRAGRAVVVIDPHKQLIRDVIKAGIPKSRLNDVELLELGNQSHPVPLNPFRLPEGMTVNDGFSYLMHVFEALYKDLPEIHQTRNYLRHIIRLLLHDPESTPFDIRRTFVDDEYRARIIARMDISTPAKALEQFETEKFWKAYNKLQGQRTQIAGPILTRTAELTSSGVMSLMLCHPQTLDFMGAIRDRKIMLFDLSEPDIRVQIDGLITLLIAGFFFASKSMGSLLGGSAPRLFFYVDEVELASSAPIDLVMGESRKFGLAAILANQYLDQVPDRQLNAILGNVGIITAFELSQDDAKKLAPSFEPFTASDLAKQGLHQVIANLRHGKSSLAPIVLDTIEPTKLEDALTEKEIRARVATEYISGDKVLEWHRKRRESTTPTVQQKPGAKPGKSSVTDFEEKSDSE